MIVKFCAKRNCKNAATDHGRCAEHSGRSIYRDSWPGYSRQRREAEDCAFAGQPGHECSGGNTVDHESNRVLCRRAHGQVEAARRG